MPEDEDLHPPPRIPAHYQFRDNAGNYERATLVTFTLPRVGELIRYGERVFKVAKVIHNVHVLKNYSKYPILTPTVIGLWAENLNDDEDLPPHILKEIEEVLRQIEDPEA